MPSYSTSPFRYCPSCSPANYGRNLRPRHFQNLCTCTLVPKLRETNTENVRASYADISRDYIRCRPRYSSLAHSYVADMIIVGPVYECTMLQRLNRVIMTLYTLQTRLHHMRRGSDGQRKGWRQMLGNVPLLATDAIFERAGTDPPHSASEPPPGGTAGVAKGG